MRLGVGRMERDGMEGNQEPLVSVEDWDDDVDVGSGGGLKSLQWWHLFRGGIVVFGLVFVGVVISLVFQQGESGPLSLKCDAEMGRYELSGHRVTSSVWCGLHDEEGPLVEAVEGSEVAVAIVGDWGRDGYCCQKDVAVELMRAMNKLNGDAVINTGDNFYEAGVANVEDDQFLTSWYNVYNDPVPIKAPWYGVLGNHDRYGDAQAQFELGTRHPSWIIPSANYTKTISSNGVKVDLIFYDTNALYYVEDERVVPMNISRHFGKEQLLWLEETVQRESTATWKIVVGHHPLFSTGVSQDELGDLENLRRQVQSILDKNGVDAYFSGHAHSLQHSHANQVDYFVSGAGSKLWPLSGQSKFSRFGVATPGFMLATFSKEQMRVEFVDYMGRILYHTIRTPRSK